MMKLMLIAALLLGGCANSPEKAVYQAHLAYDVALSGAVFYRDLPPCPAKPLCRDAEALATIQKADKVAYEALSSAQKVVRSPAATQSAMQTAATWASEAIAAFSRVVAIVKGE